MPLRCDGMPLWMRRRLSKRYQRKAPTSAVCDRCGIPWDFVTKHTTHYPDRSGAFCLCEPCFSSMTPAQRYPYYRRLAERWAEQGVNDDEVSRMLQAAKDEEG